MNGVIIAQQGFVDLERRVRVSIVAHESINQFSVVTNTGYHADSSNLLHRGRVKGIALTSIANLTSGYVISEGVIDNPAWTWTTGQIIYLNGTSLSITPPTTGFRVIIGEAITATKLYVHISESILY